MGCNSKKHGGFLFNISQTQDEQFTNNRGVCLRQKSKRKRGKNAVAKSKLIQANTKIAGGYRKIEDGFVDQYLTHGGESVEDARARLKGAK